MRLETRDIALMIVFATLYAVLSFVSLFAVIGDAGKFITLASIMAPLIGLVLGSNLGAGAVFVGGLVGWSITQTSPLHVASFAPGTITAFCSGLLYKGKRTLALVLYLILFVLLAFYPDVGPMWLFPQYLWFHLVGLLVLVSPLTSLAISWVKNGNSVAKLGFGVGTVSLVSTLLGQITGNLIFVASRYPLIYPDIEFWRIGQWQVLMFVYPFERLIIAILASFLGIPLIRSLRAYGFSMDGNKRWKS